MKHPVSRVFRHLTTRRAAVRRLFDDVTLSAIEARTREGESQHGAELRFVIEPGLAAADVRDGMTPATRALQVFSDLRIWDTEANNGVMLYLLVADHAVEIVADRAAARAVPAQAWQRVCSDLSSQYRAGAWRDGTRVAIDRIHALLAPHFPRLFADVNEYPNLPQSL